MTAQRAFTVAVLLALGSAGCGSDRLEATPSTLADEFADADAGDVIHLAEGDYGNFGGGAKRGMVTLRAEPGAAVRFDSLWLDGARNVRLEGVQIGGNSFIRGRSIEIVDSTLSGYVRVDVPGPGGHDILFQGNRFVKSTVEACGRTCYEGRLTIRGYENRRPVGVRIRNNVFAGGDMDGVQLTGSSYGVEIGPGNVFMNLRQRPDTTAHTDPVQLVDPSHAHIHHNLFRGNSTGIMAPDGSAGEQIHHNVIVTTGYPWPILLGSDRRSVVRHNTLPPGSCEWDLPCGTLRVYGGNSGVASRGTVVKDNILGHLDAEGSTLAAEDRNLIASGAGAGPGDRTGRPTFTGGARPRTWGGFRLARGSQGSGAAGDGGDVGAVRGSRAAGPALDR